MSLKLPFQQAVSEIKNRVDILSVVSKHITVKRSGSGFAAVCPFHNDKSPSMHISPSKGIFKCFACGASGDLFTFLTDFKKISFSEAVHEMAAELGIEIMAKNVSAKFTEEQDQIFQLNELAASFFQQNLQSSPEAEFVRNYLTNERGLQEGTISYFCLGYSLNNKTAFFNFVSSKPEFKEKLQSLEFIEKSGLFLEDKKYGNFIDRFRGRLMIPIKDYAGRIVAFGARTLEAEVQPKYLNSPETPVYQKGNHLFGWNLAQSFTKVQKKVLLLEGYFDVIQAHQKGINYAVGSLGTALTKEQASILYQSNLSRKIILGFDSDQAGQRALESSLHVFQEAKFSHKPDLRVLALDDSKDIDEYLLKHGAEAVENLLDKATNAYEYLIQRKVQNQNLSNNDEREKLLIELVDLIKDINDPIQKEILAEECARTLSFNKSTVMQLINKGVPTSNKPFDFPSIKNKNSYKKFKNAKQKSILPKPSSDAEKTLLAILLLTDDTKIIEEIKQAQFKNEIMKNLRDTLFSVTIEERLQYFQADQENIERINPQIIELLSVAAWVQEKGLTVVYTECLNEIGKSFSATKRLLRKKRI